MSYDGFFVQATGNAPPLPTRKTRRSTLSVASSRIRWCPSVTLIDQFRLRQEVFQLVELINKRCRNAIRQQLVGRPHMVGQTSCHGRCAWLPASRRSCPAGWFGHRPFLPQAVMGQHHMRVRHRQPQLCFQPWELCAKRIGLARQSTIVLAKRQMLSFDNAGSDCRARWS
jgi:hypothetical protein